MAPTSSGQQLPANSKPVDTKVKALWEDTTEGYNTVAPRRTRRMPPACLQRMSGMHACTLASRAVGPRPHRQGIHARRLQLQLGKDDLPKGHVAAGGGADGGGGQVQQLGGDDVGEPQAGKQVGTTAPMPPPPRATFYVRDPGSCTRRGPSRQHGSKAGGPCSDVAGGSRPRGSSGAATSERPAEVQLAEGGQAGPGAAGDSSDDSSLPSPVAVQDVEPAGGGDQLQGRLDSIYPSGWSSLPDSSSPSSLGADSSPRSLV